MQKNLKYFLTRFQLWNLYLIGCFLAGCAGTSTRLEKIETNSGLEKVKHVVVIYAENRSFDNLYGEFPYANGIKYASRESREQLDTNGQVLTSLPPVWLEKLKVKDTDKPDNSYPNFLINNPFKLNALGSGHQLSDKTRDLVHRFYQNQEQINGGKNNRFAAVSDAGGLVMGYYDGSSLPMWKYAQQFTIADNFFMGAFGGSFLNHMYLVCACAPEFNNAPDSMRVKLNDEGHLLRTSNSPSSSALGAPQYEADNAITPDGYAVNTVQSSYQPSGILPENVDQAAFADRSKYPLPPQSIRTIGDALTEKKVSWKWYSEGWDEAVRDGMQTPEAPRSVIYSKQPGSIKFQAHHQPFNYFVNFAPGTNERAVHLRDGSELIHDIENNELPAVSFYKPAGGNNEHPGYSDILTGDQHIADLIAKIQASSQWNSTVIIVTYDENGGFWDHVTPPKGDRWGPGIRIPTIIVSPFAKRNYVDHTLYDTGSIIKFISRRFDLKPMDGIRNFVGDLTHTLDLK